jgi:hypothetical protein
MLTSSFYILDEIFEQNSIQPLSLNPGKKLITSFAEMGNLISEQTTDTQFIKTLYDTLEIIIHAQIQNFPENIFWDFDFLVNNMIRQALVNEIGAVNFLEIFAHKVVLLMQLFGKHTELSFHYVHDFIYGFDWARWVQKEPENRAFIEPYNLIFLDDLLLRGQELLQLIHQDKVKYYKLSEAGYRNPFCFSREPEDEQRLLTCLARENLIPVAVWNWNAQPVWDQQFQYIREQYARKLNIGQQKN